MPGIARRAETPVLRHIGRVARTTPAEAPAVAWLHEALESGVVTEHELLAEGLGNDELRALRLLARTTDTRSEWAITPGTARTSPQIFGVREAPGP